jgi:hypothetical protein
VAGDPAAQEIARTDRDRIRAAVDRDELAYNPAERIDLPTGRATRPKRIASAPERHA